MQGHPGQSVASRKDREIPVIARTGLCNQPVGNLSLNQQSHGPDFGGKPEHMMNNRRRNVIRKVTENVASVELMTPANFTKVREKHVAVYDFQVGHVVEFLPKLIDKLGVNLNRRDGASPSNQQAW